MGGHCAPRRGHCAPGPTRDRGRACGRPAPRARGYFARQAVGGVWAGPWRGGCGPMRCPAATSAALPCGRGCRGRGISLRNSSAGAIRGASARDVQADPAQGLAATSAALPCRRGCRGRGISRRNSSEVKSRIPKPAARRRAKYPRRPRRGTSKRARHRARPRQARPSRVAEGVGDARFHVGAVPK